MLENVELMSGFLDRVKRPPRALRRSVILTGRERFLGENDLIVSKTDLKGRILYANRHFLDISGFSEAELLGTPHSILRHPSMPRAVFHLLWQRIAAGHEVFAYVVNLCRDGDHYWVFAHVTPSFDSSEQIIGYHSNRRAPRRDALPAIEELYGRLLAIEREARDRRTGLERSGAELDRLLAARGIGYDTFVSTL